MKELYKNNIEDIKNKTVQCIIDLKELEKIKVNLMLLDTQEGPTFKINSKYVHSKYFPKKEAKEFINSIDNDRYKPKLITIFGLGLGYELDESIKYFKNQSKHEKYIIEVIEPTVEVFKHYMENNNLYKNDENIIIRYIVNNGPKKEKWKPSVDYGNFEYIKSYVNLTYFEEYKESYLEYFKKMSEVVEGLSLARNTRLHFNTLWSEYGVVNLKYFFETHEVESLRNKVEGRPGILVSAGPSLNKNIEILKKAQGKFLIMCVYTAYRALTLNGIEPDFLVSIDARAKPYDEDIKNGINKPLVLYKEGNANFVKYCKKEVIMMSKKPNKKSEDIILNKKLEEKSLMVESIGGTQASAGFLFLEEIGCNPIVLVGQDLSYEKKDGVTHAKGTFYEKDKAEKKLFTVKGNHTKEVYTDKVLNSYLKWFDEHVGKIKEKTLVINATEGGAFINDTKIMKLSDVLEQYKNDELNIEEIVQKYLKESKIFKTMDEKKDYYLYLKVIEKELESLNMSVKKAYYLSEDLLNHSKNIKPLTDGKVRRLLKNLDDIDEKIQEEKSKYSLIEGAFNAVSYFDQSFELLNNELSKDERIAKENYDFHNSLKKVLEMVYKLYVETLESIGEQYNF